VIPKGILGEVKPDGLEFDVQAKTIALEEVTVKYILVMVLFAELQPESTQAESDVGASFGRCKAE
jgi:hypothetical protein